MKTYQPPRNIEEALVECQPSINKLVRKFTKNHYYLRDDLYQEAMEAVCKAWEKYDRTKANKFSTFAHFWIFAHVKDFALKEWDRMNDTYEYNLNIHDNDTYTIDDDFIDVERTIGKFDTAHQVVFERRMAGHTFQEIAQDLGITNLQKARKMYINVQESLAERF